MKKIITEDLTDDKLNQLIGANDERFANRDTITLASDESILHKTQTIIIKGARYEAVLTNKRIILVKSETGHIHEDIPFAEIDLAIPGENKFREPIITLIIDLPDGEKRTIEFIFIHFIGNKNIVELGKCIAILKEYDVPLGSRNPLAGSALLSRTDRKNTDELIVEKPVSRPAVPEWTIVGPLLNNKQSKEEEEFPEQTPLKTIGVIILVIVVMIVGITLIGQSLHEKPQTVPQNATAAVTSEVTPTPTPTPLPTPTSQVTPVPTETPPTYTIPPTGVWVKVQYPGNFSGFIGARGRNVDVSGTGVKWYQVPVVDPVIDGSIAKLDGSSDKLEVEIYKDGALNSRRSTTAPYGVIDLRMTGTEKIAPEVVITPVPTQPPVSWITDANSPQISIPPTGVWVMVQYPGNFSGYIGARGRNIDVSGTGTKWYQLPVIDPKNIDGSIAKLDGSSDKMNVDVYKDGVQISRRSTRTPYGEIELHMTGSEKIVIDVVTTPVPTPVIQAVEDYLPTISIPDTGVWVRVYYPGYFSGTVGGRGDFTTIKSTGDQLYKIPSNVGIVEGAIQKDDGSVGRIVTEVYKDGTLISRLETRKPEGLIDMHVTV